MDESRLNAQVGSAVHVVVRVELGLSEPGSVAELRDHHQGALRAIAMLIESWLANAVVAIWDAENDVSVMLIPGVHTARMPHTLVVSLMKTLETHPRSSSRGIFARRDSGYETAGVSLRFRKATRRTGGIVIVQPGGAPTLDRAGLSLLQGFAEAVEAQCELYDAAISMRSLQWERVQKLTAATKGGLPSAILDGSLVRQLPRGAVLVFDRDLRYVFADGDALRWTKKKRDEFEGRHLSEIVSEANLARLEEVYRGALAGRTDLTEVQSEDRFYMAMTMPITSSQGEIVAGAVLVQDVTESRQLEARLRASASAINAKPQM